MSTNSPDLHGHLLSLPILYISRAANTQKYSTILCIVSVRRCADPRLSPGYKFPTTGHRPLRASVLPTSFASEQSAIFTPTRPRSKGSLPPSLGLNDRARFVRYCERPRGIREFGVCLLKRSLHRFPTCCAAAVSLERSARRQVFPERRPKQHQVCLARTAAGSQR
jgi:hypothetical protein